MSVVSRRCHIGVDLGKKQNHSAIVVVEQLVVTTGRRNPMSFEPIWERRMTATHIEQLKLGVEYTAIVERLHGLTHSLTHSRELETEVLTTCVDATGLGEVVMEMLRKQRLRGELMPVVFTGGRTARYTKGAYTVPKQELVQGLGAASGAGGTERGGGGAGVRGMNYESAGVGLLWLETEESSGVASKLSDIPNHSVSRSRQKWKYLRHGIS